MTRSLVGKAVHGCAAALLASQAFAAGPAPLDRTILPIQEPARPLYSEIDARKVAMPPRFEVKAPDGAPNVVIVLIDDMGFGVPMTFGGPVTMPTLDSLRAGTRFSGFTAPSSPGSTRPGGSARLNRLSECSVIQPTNINIRRQGEAKRGR